MKRAILIAITLYTIFEIAYCNGCNKVEDSDLVIPTPKYDPQAKIPVDTSAFIKKDTTPYKGNWVDIN